MESYSNPAAREYGFDFETETVERSQSYALSRRKFNICSQRGAKKSLSNESVDNMIKTFLPNSVSISFTYF